jgi:hypothetical protein
MRTTLGVSSLSTYMMRSLHLVLGISLFLLIVWIFPLAPLPTTLFMSLLISLASPVCPILLPPHPTCSPLFSSSFCSPFPFSSPVYHIVTISTHSSCPFSSKKPSKNSIRTKKEGVNLIVDKDVALDTIPSLISKTPVGRFIGKVLMEHFFIHWMDQNWCPMLSYSLNAHMMVHGWVSFQFRYEEDVSSILSKDWFWGALQAGSQALEC